MFSGGCTTEQDLGKHAFSGGEERGDTVDWGSV